MAGLRDARAGVGLHALVAAENTVLCLTQDEVEHHPAWLGFAESAGKHPPLRGLLAVPIVGEDGLNYGLLQVSDKADGGDFDEEDECRLQHLAGGAAVDLDALRKVRALRLGETRPPYRSRPPRSSSPSNAPEPTQRLPVVAGRSEPLTELVSFVRGRGSPHRHARTPVRGRPVPWRHVIECVAEGTFSACTLFVRLLSGGA
jgi:hypothetical protein